MRYLPLPGTTLEQVDTPALIVDLPAMEHNIAVLHSFFKERPAKVRPHFKAHKCPAIARIQVATGGTVGGLCCASVGEAEALVEGGIHNVLVASEITPAAKINRLMSLAKQAEILVAVDNPQNVKDLSEAAQAWRTSVGVLIDVESGLHRCGIEPGQPAVDLGKLVAKSQCLQLRGIMTYEGIHIEDREERALETQRRLGPVVKTAELFRKAGLPVDILSAGGTDNWDMAGSFPGVTEVQAGAYALMQLMHRYHTEFRVALKMLHTVVSHPAKDRVILDGGHYAVGHTYGLIPEVEHPTGAKVTKLNSEHIILEVEGDAAQLQPGDKLLLTMAYSGTASNVFSHYIGLRNGKVETVWDIAGRGRLQ